MNDDIPKLPNNYLQILRDQLIGKVTDPTARIPPGTFFTTDLRNYGAKPEFRAYNFLHDTSLPLTLKAWQPNEVVMKLTLDELGSYAYRGSKVEVIMQAVESSHYTNELIANLVAHARFHYPMGGQ